MLQSSLFRLHKSLQRASSRFIDIVEKALPFDCYELTCSTEEERVKSERRDNFINIVFNVLKLPGSLADENTSTNALMPEPQVENAIIEQSVSTTAQTPLPTNPPIKPILLPLDNEQEEESIVRPVEPVSLPPPPPPLTIMQQWPTKTDLSSNSNPDSQNDQSSYKQTEDTLIPLKSGSSLNANWFGMVAVCVVVGMIVI